MFGDRELNSTRFVYGHLVMSCQNETLNLFETLSTGNEHFFCQDDSLSQINFELNQSLILETILSKVID